MAIRAGKVQSIENGKFFVKNINGSIKELELGDTIFEDDTVYGDILNKNSARIEIALKDNNVFILVKNQRQLIDSSLIDEEFGKEELLFILEDMKQLLEISKRICNN